MKSMYLFGFTVFVGGCAVDLNTSDVEGMVKGGTPKWQQTAPVNMGPVINTGLRESEPSFTENGKTMYFNCRGGLFGGPLDNNNEICVSYLTGNFEDNNWSTPELVGPPISTPGFFDAEPIISPDGLTLQFTSTRPGGLGGLDIWVSQNVDGVWQQPVNLGAPINTPFLDHCFIPMGDMAYMASNRPGGLGGNDLYEVKRVNGVWQTPVNLGPKVNSPASDHMFMPTPDGNAALVTTSFQWPGSQGLEDNYITIKDANGNWGPLQNLGPLVNSPKADRCPWLTPNNKFLVFDSERAGGSGFKDLWWIYYKNITRQFGLADVDADDDMTM